MDSKTGKPGSFANASSLTAQTTQTTQVTSVVSEGTPGIRSTNLPLTTTLAPLSPNQLRLTLADQVRIRETLVLQEILQPPVSRRGKRGR